MGCLAIMTANLCPGAPSLHGRRSLMFGLRTLLPLRSGNGRLATILLAGGHGDSLTCKRWKTRCRAPAVKDFGNRIRRLLAPLLSKLVFYDPHDSRPQRAVLPVLRQCAEIRRGSCVEGRRRHRYIDGYTNFCGACGEAAGDCNHADGPVYDFPLVVARWASGKTCWPSWTTAEEYRVSIAEMMAAED